MRILELKLENFLSYANQKIDLSGVRLASVVGQNGAGKSSILDAILYSLFGVSRAKTDEELIRLGAEDMSVQMLFEIGGEIYTVKRSRGRSSGTRLNFESSKEQMIGATIKETQQFISDVVKMNSSVFTSSAFILQNKFDEFVQKTSSEKKRILMDALDLNRFVDYENQSKNKLRQFEIDEEVNKHRLDSFHLEFKLLDEQQLEVRKRIAEGKTAEAKNQIVALSKKVSALKETYDKIKSQQEQYFDKKNRMLKLESEGKNLVSQVKNAENNLDELCERLKKGVLNLALKESSLEDIEKKIEFFQSEDKKYFSKQSRLESQRETLLRDVARLEKETGKCPTCGQDLPALVVEKIRNDASVLKQEIQKVEREIENTKGYLDTLKDNINGVKIWVLEFKRLELVNKIADLNNRIVELRTEYKKLKDEVAMVDGHEDLNEIKFGIQSVENEIGKHQEVIDSQNRFLGEVDEKLKRILTLNDFIKATSETLEKIQKDKLVYQELQLAFSKKGIPSFIIDDSLPMLQDESNRLLARFGGQFKVEFVKKDDKIDSLDLYAEDIYGRREISMDSGGEVVRIALAVRIALSKLLMNRANSRIELLIVDEPSGLDEQGIEQLIEILGVLSQDFKQILVISHLQELAGAFPNTVYVNKKPSGSEVLIQ